MLTIPRKIIIVLTTIHRALKHMERIHDIRYCNKCCYILYQYEKAILVFPEEYISSDYSVSVTGLTEDALKDIITCLPGTSVDERARYS